VRGIKDYNQRKIADYDFARRCLANLGVCTTLCVGRRFGIIYKVSSHRRPACHREVEREGLDIPSTPNAPYNM